MLTIIIGAIVITHEKVVGEGIQPYTSTDISSIDDRQRDLLEADAEQSVNFLEIVQLPTADDVVSFPIPPGNAGKWQLFGVGMRHRIENLGEIQDDSPIYYGFIGEFLNNKVSPGDTIGATLTLKPACNTTYQPSPPCL